MRAVRLRLLAATAMLGFAPAIVAAQQATPVSGIVTSEAGQPLPSVQVSIPTYGVGAVTRDDGRYTFTVPGTRTGTATVVARRIGLQQKTASITLGQGAVTLNFTLAASVSQLEGLVVTALGQTREKSQLGTAQQQLSNTELTQTRAQNVMQQVQGKVSGVQITASGTQGGSTNVIIRGQNSILGNN